jgi:hypothetical protein
MSQGEMKKKGYGNIRRFTSTLLYTVTIHIVPDNVAKSALADGNIFPLLHFHRLDLLESLRT